MLRGKEQYRLCMKYFAIVSLKIKNKNLIICKRALSKYVLWIKVINPVFIVLGLKGLI